ncbi:hypothetical protein BC827DRAFT_1203515 [Russula dissimulans]|nr:hypothetical protein BC827DRAFT_1203515 [Russula dissimulans]
MDEYGYNLSSNLLPSLKTFSWMTLRNRATPVVTFDSITPHLQAHPPDCTLASQVSMASRAPTSQRLAWTPAIHTPASRCHSARPPACLFRLAHTHPPCTAKCEVLVAMVRHYIILCCSETDVNCARKFVRRLEVEKDGGDRASEREIVY